MSDRVIVFIDAQNMYQGARRAFFQKRDYHILGQFRPHDLAKLVAASGRPGANRALSEVRVYSGRPDATKQPRAYAAHMKQCTAWAASGVTIVTRTLRYPHNWPTEKEREKGIDVALAIDFVSMAIDDRYDTGVLASVDTDLTPALEYVARNANLAKVVEVTGWRSERARGRLGVRGMNIWCHWLDVNVYNTLADPTDYAQ